ncbi:MULTISPECIES: GNAT family N-acetyltransferase [unclassified Fusibacter]|uniref:GNAT family N-acetyltransferase n=1 Tax=unclassified Fusibacter TaxID=2624464 RepID=UPI00101261A4|nr:MULTISPECIES: GNAT family N-acetyltransferase [unclassified Fusibacter]MCK8058726.1 GNAT family N-acetyltransferase [Fusibacter sp. A2]NPE21800.1 GNAT family N-acetyltransferase [Fusibacter sp. A1]RXV61372.1 GNAT family N-acetyltransferase [Fusibacter sp. A1]
MTKNEIYKTLLEQLSYDMNCSQDELLKSGVTLVEAGNHDKRRKFTQDPIVFGMLTLGEGAVMSARPELLADLNQYKAFEYPLRLFEHFKMTEIDQLLKKNGFSMTGLSEFYLPDPKNLPTFTISDDYRIDWYEGDHVAELFKHEGFHNALSYYIKGLRPDVIAVTASLNNQIIGMAGASADSEMMWQVGIDVLKEHRGMGIGTFLVSEITKRILLLDKVPYYGTWNANIGSRKIALKCGYMPAWTEVY